MAQGKDRTGTDYSALPKPSPRLSIRLKADEQAEWAKVANEQGCNLSGWVRAIIRDEVAMHNRAAAKHKTGSGNAS